MTKLDSNIHVSSIQWVFRRVKQPPPRPEQRRLRRLHNRLVARLKAVVDCLQA
ncbi:MAG: hypothetical protein LBD24_08705 [Spirochaetaceae bacterium]|nr:hypothetical protein [Spirochaetaceae bacterium]